ncbi:MAG: PAS domain S-box protein [Magnetococcales bacterium]|nr:PAS domain S-box protein [Magnetococcales bacterium]
MDQPTDKRLWRIRQPIIASFLPAFGVLVAIFLFSLQWMHSEQEQNFSNHFRQQITSLQALITEESQRAMEGQLLGLALDQTLTERFQARDRAGLLAEIKPLFDHLKQEQGISHLYFHTLEGDVFLRVHRPEQHGDRIERTTLRTARTTDQTSHGFELGRSGGLILRVVVPWKVRGQTIGYLEMGKDMPALMERIHTTLQVDLHLFLEKQFLDARQWRARVDPPEPVEAWEQFEHLVHAGGTGNIPTAQQVKQLEKPGRLNGIFPHAHPETNGVDHTHYFMMPIHDVEARAVGKLVVVFEDQPLEKITSAHKSRVILAISLSAIFLGWVFHRLLLRVEGNLRAATAGLRHGEQRNRAILDTALDAIISIDTTGRILEFNKAAERIFGFRKQDVLGTDISETIIPPEMRAAHRQGLARYLATGEKRVINQHIELDAMHANGVRIPTEMAITVIPGENFTFFTAFLRDISERKQMLASLNDAIAAAEASNQQLRQEVIRHELTLARLQASEERFRSVTLSIRDAIIATDHEQTIIFWNKGAEVLFGYTREEILGKKLTPLIPERHVAAHRRGFQRFLERGEAPLIGQTTELTGLRKNGQEFPLEMSLSTWTHGDGARFFSAVIRDSTERKHTEEMLLAAKESAEAANRAKSLFLANMSHEIRTPMNTIIGMGYLLSQTPLTPGQFSRMRKIQSAAETLLGIINDILDFSKIEAGRMELEHHPFLLGEVMEKVAGMVAMRAEEKGLEILFALSPDLPRALIGDALRLEQILINLGTNAVKFTHSGEIVFRVEALETTEQMVKMRFSVQDSGIGLSTEQIAGLFRPFVQADSSTTRHYGGTGLGLAICKSLVDQMKGAFSVISAPGAGSEFAFTVPLERQPPDHHATPTTLPADEPCPLRILVVDDNESARQILSEMARALECNVMVVASGSAALREMERVAAAGERPYDVVLLDWQMPEMNGLETARQIRANVAMHSTLVIMVTAFGRQEVMKEAKDVGINGFMLKPVTPSLLLNTIQEAMGKPLPPSEDHPLQGRSEKAPDQLRGARILVVEDHEINWQVAEGILSRAGVRAEHASNGLEALERLTEQPDAFDAVLMDLQMPVMDGYEATRRLRVLFDAERLPIIAMTANALKSEKDHCLALGMNDYLTKPVHVSQLYAVLAAHLSERHVKRMVEIAPPPTAGPLAPFPEVAGIDTRTAMERLGGDGAMLARLARQFVHLHRATGTRVAERLVAQDLEGARTLLHGIKGVAGNLAAHGVAAWAARLEDLAKQGDVDGCWEGLGTLNAEIDALVQAIEAMEPPEALPRREPGTAPLATFPAEALQQVRQLLIDGDFQAREAFATIRAALLPWLPPERLARIERHLELLQFEAAADLLSGIDDEEG